MRIPDEICSQLAVKFAVLFPHLDERQRRLLTVAEARLLGRGGIRAVARAAEVSETTVRKGVFELEAGEEPLGRVRRPGGGRKRVADLDPGLRPALLALVEPDERGDPMSPLRWTVKSTRTLARELTRAGHTVSADTVAGLLREEGFSLQANTKSLEGGQHPDRDAQFRYLNEQVREHRDAGQPVISVDTKKKELVGDFKNTGRQWRPAGDPVPVHMHDFADPLLGKAAPYGVYDLAENTGWVHVGTDHDTAAFAVESIRRWWHGQGQAAYPRATRLLITADAGGSNGYRTRAWKLELARLAAETGLTITVCHLPPGTSKWNKIEHRLFSYITMNWRGRPLTSHEVIVQSIAATTTRTGLRVTAQLDTNTYPTGVKIGDAETAALPLTRHTFHGDWNYALHPQPAPTVPAPRARQAPPRQWDQAQLSHPELTGMTHRQLDHLATSLAPDCDPQRGRPFRLPFPEQVLATVLHLHLALAAEPLAVLFGSSRTAMHRTLLKNRRLLKAHGISIPPATTPPTALAALQERVLTLTGEPSNKIETTSGVGHLPLLRGDGSGVRVCGVSAEAADVDDHDGHGGLGDLVEDAGAADVHSGAGPGNRRGLCLRSGVGASRGCERSACGGGCPRSLVGGLRCQRETAPPTVVRVVVLADVADGTIHAPFGGLLGQQVGPGKEQPTKFRGVRNVGRAVGEPLVEPRLVPVHAPVRILPVVDSRKEPIDDASPTRSSEPAVVGRAEVFDQGSQAELLLVKAVPSAP